jgi:DNA-binding NarL/FixJ family response regulator
VSEQVVVPLQVIHSAEGDLQRGHPSAASARVAVVDPDSLARVAVRALLDGVSDASLVDERSSLDPGCTAGDASILLIDAFAVPDGLAALAELCQRFSVIVFTRLPDTKMKLACYAAGALACLSKSDSLPSLELAIRAVANGHAVVDATVLQTLAAHESGREILQEQQDERVSSLTQREREVLQLVAAGYSNDDIAAALHTSCGTARCHVSRIMTKLASPNRSQLVLLAAGLVGAAAPGWLG